jgi:hypothetical protein
MLKMLSPEEKEEMLKDGRDIERRNAFRRARRSGRSQNPSFDFYLRTISDIQRVFNSIVASTKKNISGKNKL